MRKEENLMYESILNTTNFPHEMESKYCKMGVSIKINNENEEYILHFIFHTKILHIKSLRIPIIRNKKNNTISYGETMYITQNMIQDYLSKRTIYLSTY